MGFKDIIKNFGNKNKERKEVLRQMDQQVRMQKIIEERQLSSNERELNRYANEDREAMIKEQLEFARRKRDEDIKFGHNPINAKNIMKAQWEIMKEKSQFSKKSDMFTNHKSILKSNNNLLKSNDNAMKGGNLFKI